ncbi:Plasmodium exported protein (PHISTc), unknown function, partial [Plasmodium malariae]
MSKLINMENRNLIKFTFLLCFAQSTVGVLFNIYISKSSTVSEVNLSYTYVRKLCENYISEKSMIDKDYMERALEIDYTTESFKIKNFLKEKNSDKQRTITYESLHKNKTVEKTLDDIFGIPESCKIYEFHTSIYNEKLNNIINSLKHKPSRRDMYNIWNEINFNERNKYISVIEQMYKIYKYLGKVYKINKYFGKKEWKKCFREFKIFVRERKNYLNYYFTNVINDKSTTLREFKYFLNFSVNISNILMKKAIDKCLIILNTGMLHSSTLDLDPSILNELNKNVSFYK